MQSSHSTPKSLHMVDPRNESDPRLQGISPHMHEVKKVIPALCPHMLTMFPHISAVAAQYPCFPQRIRTCNTENPHIPVAANRPTTTSDLPRIYSGRKIQSNRSHISRTAMSALTSMLSSSWDLPVAEQRVACSTTSYFTEITSVPTLPFFK